MDLKTKQYMLYAFTILAFLLVSVNIYKAVFQNHSIVGAIVLSIFVLFGYAITYTVLNHDIKKFERWKQEAVDFTKEDIASVSHISLSSTRENGRNTVILSATYNDYELTFSGIHPDFQFKYKVGDPIKIRVHPQDKQRFVLDDLK